MSWEILVNNAAGNGLLPGDTKPVPEPGQWISYAIHLTNILQYADNQEGEFETIIFDILLHLPVVNVLMPLSPSNKITNA